MELLTHLSWIERTSRIEEMSPHVKKYTKGEDRVWCCILTLESIQKFELIDNSFSETDVMMTHKIQACTLSLWVKFRWDPKPDFKVRLIDEGRVEIWNHRSNDRGLENGPRSKTNRSHRYPLETMNPRDNVKTTKNLLKSDSHRLTRIRSVL